jgi:hypothetical protein
VFHIWKDGSYGSGIASQFVGNDPQRFDALTTQEFPKEALCRTLITTCLNQDVDHITILIDGTPQILQLSIDSKEDLIQMPAVSQPALSSLQLPNVARTELLAPLPDRLIQYGDSALGKKILNIPEAQAKR